MTSFQFVGNVPLAITLGLLAAGIAAALYTRGLQGSQHRSKWLLPALRATAILLLALTLAEPTIRRTTTTGRPASASVLVDVSPSMSLPLEPSLASRAGQQDPTIEINRAVQNSTGQNRAATLDSIGPNQSASLPQERLTDAVDNLLKPLHLLDELASSFELSIWTVGINQDELLWQSQPIEQRAPSRQFDRDTIDSANPDSRTALGDSVLRAVSRLSAAPAATSSRSIILISDGQSNSGTSLLSAAEELAEAKIKLYTLGVGAGSQVADLSLLDLRYPPSVRREDVFRGRAVVQDSLPEGTDYWFHLRHQGKVVWEKKFTAGGRGVREFEFSLPAQLLADSVSGEVVGRQEDTSRIQPAPQTGQVRLPIELRAELSTSAAEMTLANNHATAGFVVESGNSKVLLIDSRSRWETRYLKNLFARDPHWQLDNQITSAHTPPLKAEESNLFGKTKDELLDYHLIILGDVELDRADKESQRWLIDFVQTGGGLILIDGARGQLAASQASLGALLPIRWEPHRQESEARVVDSLEKYARPTTIAAQLEAFQLTTAASPSMPQAAVGKAIENDSDNASNDGPKELTQPETGSTGDRHLNVWQSLPPLYFVSKTTPAPGGEVLLEAVSDVETWPLMVSRRFGAGRVLYVASDETWRWRYKSVDRLHQRFWNQIARWTQRTPMSVEGEFVSIDAGPAAVVADSDIVVRCRLRDQHNAPSVDHSVFAVFRSTDGSAIRMPMKADNDVPGEYRLVTSQLPVGSYEVSLEADGFQQSALDVSTTLSVLAPENPELHRLECNEELLRQAASRTGGRYFPIEQADQLRQLLESTNGVTLERQTLLLWQSSIWFSAAILLLAIEWLLRKRSGLV